MRGRPPLFLNRREQSHDGKALFDYDRAGPSRQRKTSKLVTTRMQPVCQDCSKINGMQIIQVNEGQNPKLHFYTDITGIP